MARCRTRSIASRQHRSSLVHDRPAAPANSRGLLPQPLPEMPPLKSKLVEFERGDHLYSEGTPDNLVFKLEKGVALSYEVSSSGTRRVFAIHTPGDLIGLDAAVAAHTHCVAIVRGRAAAFERSELLNHIKSDAGFAVEVCAQVLRERQWTDEHIISLGLPAIERLARYLLRMEERQHQNGSIYLPISRRDLGDYLGLTIETVSRMFTQLKTAGAIHLETCNLITVSDRVKLRTAAGFAEGSV